MKTERRLSDLRSEFPRPVAPARNLPILVLVFLAVFFAFGPALQAQEESVGLGTADDFALLSGETITNTGPTSITGDVGVHPGAAAPGFEASITLDGEFHETDAVAEQAKVDLVTAYDDADGRSVTATVDTELGGETLIPGVYDSASTTFEITGTLTLDAQGDPNAVFIFQMGSTLLATTGSSVILTNGAQACNVFWQVTSSATLEAGSSFVGNILALTSITLETGATVEGRVLARNGSVTLDSNTITRAVCAAAAPDTTTTTAAPDTTTTAAAATTTSAAGTATTVAPPVGGVDTGGGSSTGAPNLILLLGGSSLLALAVGAFVVRQRLLDRRSG